MIVPISDGASLWWNPITFTLWGIACVWLGAILFYRKQAVYMNILTCELSPKSNDDFTITVSGFINSRHPDGLTDLRLWLHPQYGINPSPDSTIPNSIDSKPQIFKANFPVTYSFFNQASEEQQTDGVNILWVLSAQMVSDDWLCRGVISQIGLIRNGKVERISMEGKTKRKAERRNKGLGLTNHQFHKILDKASQPIKKSEKGKSQA